MIHDAFARPGDSPFGGHIGMLGIRHIADGPDWVELACPFSTDFLLDVDSGFSAAGPIYSLVDAAAGAAIIARLGEFEPLATLDLRIDHLRSACVGEPLHARAPMLPSDPAVGVHPLPRPSWYSRRSHRLRQRQLLLHLRVLIEATPFGRMLGIGKFAAQEGTSLLVLPVNSRLEGRPGFLYGGVIASLIELACVEAVLDELGASVVRPKPINIALDFLRGGLLVETFAEASLVRIGKRIVNASALCWQQDRARPIAVARMHVALHSGR